MDDALRFHRSFQNPHRIQSIERRFALSMSLYWHFTNLLKRKTRFSESVVFQRCFEIIVEGTCYRAVVYAARGGQLIAKYGCPLLRLATKTKWTATQRVGFCSQRPYDSSFLDFRFTDSLVQLSCRVLCRSIVWPDILVVEPISWLNWKVHLNLPSRDLPIWAVSTYSLIRNF